MEVLQQQKSEIFSKTDNRLKNDHVLSIFYALMFLYLLLQQRTKEGRTEKTLSFSQLYEMNFKI